MVPFVRYLAYNIEVVQILAQFNETVNRRSPAIGKIIEIPPVDVKKGGSER